MKFGSVCEIAGCDRMSEIPSISILTYPSVKQHLKENTSRNVGTLAYLCWAHKEEFGIIEETEEETVEETVQETEDETED
jgi:hypothetical protein